MIRVVTFDAADTIIRHQWDGAAVLLESARQLGLCDLDEVRAREAYQRVILETRSKHEEIEKLRDRNATKAYWQTVVEMWLSALEQNPATGRALHEISEQKVFAPGAMIWALFEDVLPTLSELNRQEIRVGLVSNWDSSLHRVLETIGIEGQFSFIIASLEYGVEKPDKRIFRIAEQIGGFSANEAMHVGDSYEDDFVGAVGAGWKALHLDRTQGADFSRGRISSLTQVLETVKRCA